MSIEPQPPFVYRWMSHFVVADSLDRAWAILTDKLCFELPAGVTLADAVAHYTASVLGYDLDPANQMRREVKGLLEDDTGYCLEGLTYDLRARECLHRVPDDDWVEIDERMMPSQNVDIYDHVGMPPLAYATITASASEWARHYREGYIGGNDPNA